MINQFTNIERKVGMRLPKSTDTRGVGIGQNVEMTLGVSGCGQCRASKCGVLGVVSGWWICCLPHNEGSLLLLCVLFGSLIPTYLLFNFCTLFFILVFVTFLDFSFISCLLILCFLGSLFFSCTLYTISDATCTVTRRACAAKVTVPDLCVCMCVCVFALICCLTHWNHKREYIHVCTNRFITIWERFRKR